MVNGTRRKPPVTARRKPPARRQPVRRPITSAIRLPKGRASALPRGSVIRKGLRGKKPLATTIIRNARRNQRLGTTPRSVGINVFGDRRRRRKKVILGFRTDGRLP